MKEIVFACPPEGFYTDVVTWEAKLTWKQKGAAFCLKPPDVGEVGFPSHRVGRGPDKEAVDADVYWESCWKRFRFKAPLDDGDEKGQSVENFAEEHGMKNTSSKGAG